MKRTANHNEWWPRAERREALGNAIACTRRAGAEPDPELRADLQRVVDGTMTGPPALAGAVQKHAISSQEVNKKRPHAAAETGVEWVVAAPGHTQWSV
jgi:hypothetical protein